VTVGVIGAGLMGAIHARLLGSALVADPRPEVAADFADGLELIASPDVDAVVIASPVPTHERFALACIEAGKRVLCEKPLAGDAAAALRIAEADTAGLVTVGFMRRFDPAYVDLRGRLAAVGSPLLVHCVHRNPSVHSFFDASMILTDSVAHEIDITRWLLGEEIVRVTVIATRPDPLLVILETEGAKLVTVEAFANAGYGYDIRCEVVGETGTVELPRAVARNFEERFEAAYREELRAWLAGEPGPSAWDGYAACAVSEAAVESLATGRPVAVRNARRHERRSLNAEMSRSAR
jgi:myo-inositol 2-dehydrogenase/D-chiro-inositol 1-dehydrogenase